MNTMTHREYLNSEEWKQLRKQALDRDGNRCRVCNSEDELNVHHRKYPEERNNWETDCLDQLTTLCRKCHYHYHKKTDDNNSINREESSDKEDVYNLVNFILRDKLDDLEQSAQSIFNCIKIAPLHEGPLSIDEKKQGYTKESVLIHISGLSCQLKSVIREIEHLRAVFDDDLKSKTIDDLVFVAKMFIDI